MAAVTALREDIELAQHLATDAEKAALYDDLAAGCESGWDFSSRWMMGGGNPKLCFLALPLSGSDIGRPAIFMTSAFTASSFTGSLILWRPDSRMSRHQVVLLTALSPL